MLETISLDEDDAAERYLSATPNSSPAAVLLYNVLHWLCFAQRPAAKNSVSPIQFHLLSLISPNLFGTLNHALDVRDMPRIPISSLYQCVLLGAEHMP
jgi:hypothetical protein